MRLINPVLLKSLKPALFGLLLPFCLATASAQAAYLGMRVQNLPPHVKAHLPDGIDKNQGVIVDWLEDISPAADEGVKEYDVLLSYNDKPIQSAQSFTQTIRSQAPGSKGQLGILRQGKIIKLEVTTTVAPKEKMTARPKQPLLFKLPSPVVPVKPARRPIPAAARPRNIAGKPAFPMRKKPEKHAWGTERNIWPDFYTDGTSEVWDKMINGPFKMGRMPGGWRAPSLSMPDPVTIGDAVTNQMPPMAEEMGNMIDISK